ncbi:MAG: 50S ribosomal protein L17 [Candidatus Pacebacteria bacterium]|nr:50S ribosomal protein L17 [Candidatus Paceibacterota bacterium]
MRHRVAKKHFNRDTNNRKALLKNLLRSLIEQGEIVTTTSKAKEIKRLMDKTVHRAKTDSVENRRLLHKIFGRRDVVNTLVDRIAPAMADRVSGFTTIAKEGIRRGDSANQSRLKFVVKIDRVGTLKSGQDHTKKVPAKKTVAKKAAPKKVAAKKAPAKKVEKK